MTHSTPRPLPPPTRRHLRARLSGLAPRRRALVRAHVPQPPPDLVPPPSPHPAPPAPEVPPEIELPPGGGKAPQPPAPTPPTAAGRESRADR